MAFENSFRTKQKDARGRSIFKDRDTGTLFTVDDKGNQIVGRPGSGSSSRSSNQRRDDGGGGGDSFNLQDFISRQFESLPSAQDEARRLEQERENRLREFVDPVLSNQRSVIEGLRGRSNLEDLFSQLRTDRGVEEQEDRIRDLGGETSSVLEILRQLPESVNKRTAGTFTTEAQRQAIEAKERQPLAQDLQSLSNLLAGERSGLAEVLQGITQQLGLRQTQEARELEPLQTSLLFSGQNLDRARGDEASRLQNLLTGFQSDQGNILSRITSSIGAQQQLQQQEQDRLAAAVRQQFEQSESQKDRNLTVSEGAADRAHDSSLARLRASLDNSSKTTVGTDSPEVLAWVDEILNDNASIGNVPSDLKNTVALALNEQRNSSSDTAAALQAALGQSGGGSFFSPQPGKTRVRDVFRELGNIFTGGRAGAGAEASSASRPLIDQSLITPNIPAIPLSLY